MEDLDWEMFWDLVHMRKYHILKQLEGGVGIPHVLWFGRESTYHALALNLLGSSLHDIFLIHSQKFSLHAVINLSDQLVVAEANTFTQLSRLEYIHSHNYVHGDIKPQNVMSCVMEFLSSSRVFSFTLHSLAFSEDPDYDYLCSLLHGLHATLPASATCLLDFGKPDDLSTHTPAIPDEYRVTEVTPPYPLKATPLRRSTCISSYLEVYIHITAPNHMPQLQLHAAKVANAVDGTHAATTPASLV
ncbi:uncharacterized protein EDB91DRAFT_1085075 [Suillus paluster]|uniref:uncharacterized protein n=1 Tax=Suillus paluster TaxID=48578 RepID=UPI001B8660AC|nr:uncharacterized protein EDB91DRAFT_1085075 [Suillus paluster]KAG1731315.1 hypothetical protein EDB91DRAFT_1085075 [Suillus paluster]